MTTNPHTIDLKAAADMLKVHRTTALELVQTGEIPAAKVGRAYVLLTKDVLTYIQNQIMDQTGERLSARKTRKASPARPAGQATRARLQGRSL